MADPAAPPASVEMPAARLRKGDALPAYGPDVTVVRHPVISVDGAMVNALIAAAHESPQLVRLPAGLRIDVVRPAGDASPTADGFVRSTKVARSSGARIAVLDLLHTDSEVAAEPGEKFATLCTVHHTVKTHAGISTAQAQATHPEQWCAGCRSAAQDLAHQRVWGAPATNAAGGTGA